MYIVYLEDEDYHNALGCPHSTRGVGDQRQQGRVQWGVGGNEK